VSHKCVLLVGSRVDSELAEADTELLKVDNFVTVFVKFREQINRVLLHVAIFAARLNLVHKDAG